MSRFKRGDKVVNKFNGEVGTVLMADPAGMPDCVVVIFREGGDGYTIPKSQLLPLGEISK